MKLGLGLLSPFLGAFVGYRVGLWWLHRTVESPELETAVYPVTGAVIGGLIGVVLGVLVAWNWKPSKNNDERN